MGERDSGEWGEVIADLGRQRAGIAAELDGVDAEARPLALPAIAH